MFWFNFLAQPAILTLPYESTKVCIKVYSSVGVVGLDTGTLKCLICRYGTRSCCHIQKFNDLVTSNDQSVPDLEYELAEKANSYYGHASSYVYVLTPVSHSKIQFEMSETTSKALCLGYQNALNKVNGVYELVPYDNCANCERISCQRLLEVEAPLFNRSNPLLCKGLFLI